MMPLDRHFAVFAGTHILGAGRKRAVRRRNLGCSEPPILIV